MNHHASCSAFVEKVLLLLLLLLQCGFTSSFGEFDCYVTVRHRSGTPPDEIVKYVMENAQEYGDIVHGNPVKACPLIYGCFSFRCLDSKRDDLFVISGCFNKICDDKLYDFCREAGGKPRCKDCFKQILMMGNPQPCNKEMKELNKIHGVAPPVEETTTTTEEPTTTFEPPEIFVEFNLSVIESGTVTAASISAINTVVVPIIGAAIVRSMALA
ncbi:hypothetical protein niasHS_009166 [Heterodera schachtii]|uniref:Uncharacterized protein n=1 Tax=Heterodera schachtii TaxID=97005 RepID=A0ABD2JE37_HETSC